MDFMRWLLTIARVVAGGSRKPPSSRFKSISKSPPFGGLFLYVALAFDLPIFRHKRGHDRIARDLAGSSARVEGLSPFFRPLITVDLIWLKEIGRIPGV